jgi:hypothetical protein
MKTLTEIFEEFTPEQQAAIVARAQELVGNDLVYRLRKRAEIRRQISSRKSVQEGKPDRIADLLEEAANEIERHRKDNDARYNEELHRSSW